MFIINLLGCYFLYNGVFSKKYNLILGSISTDENTNLSGKYELKTIYNKAGVKNYIIDHDYSDAALEFEAEVVTADGKPLSNTDMKEIRKWLFTQSDYRKLYGSQYYSDYEISISLKSGSLYYSALSLPVLGEIASVWILDASGSPTKSLTQADYVSGATPNSGTFYYNKDNKELYFNKSDLVSTKADISFFSYPGGDYFTDDSEVYGTYLNCVFTEPEKIEGNGGTIGYKFNIVCDSAGAWQDEVTQTKKLSLSSTTSSANITVAVDNELNSFVYPEIHIVMGSTGGTVTLTNNTDDSTRLTTLANLPANADIVIDSALNYISGRNYANMTDKNFPRMVDGDNTYAILGNVETIEFTYNNRKLV